MSANALNLSLLRDEYGSFILSALSIVPDPSYHARPAFIGAPHGINVPADALPVTLPLARDSSGTFVIQVCVPVMHELSGLHILPGQVRIIAFLVCDGRILGQTSVMVADAQPVVTVAVVPRTLVGTRNTARLEAAGPGEHPGGDGPIPLRLLELAPESVDRTERTGAQFIESAWSNGILRLSAARGHTGS